MKFLLTSMLLVGALAGLPAADGEKTPRQPAAQRAATGAGGADAIERILTEDQRQEMREFVRSQGGSFLRDMQQMSELRRELMESALNGKATESWVREKTQAIARLEAEQLTVRTLALAKVAGSLTDEQRTKIKELSERLRSPRAEAVPRQREAAAPPPPEK